ncbi:hypothetical protein QBC98_002755 [Kitasatospora acidiphila]
MLPYPTGRQPPWTRAAVVPPSAAVDAAAQLRLIRVGRQLAVLLAQCAHPGPTGGRDRVRLGLPRRMRAGGRLGPGSVTGLRRARVRVRGRQGRGRRTGRRRHLRPGRVSAGRDGTARAGTARRGARRQCDRAVLQLGPGTRHRRTGRRAGRGTAHVDQGARALDSTTGDRDRRREGETGQRGCGVSMVHGWSNERPGPKATPRQRRRATLTLRRPAQGHARAPVAGARPPPPWPGRGRAHAPADRVRAAG